MTDDLLQINEQVRIPWSELGFRFSRGSGPGGQHVNRSETQVELVFDLAGSPSLTEEQKARALAALAQHVDSRGVLHLVSQSSRSQWRNRQEVIERFQTLLRNALRPRKRRIPTRPSPEARRRRLEEKRRRSEIKRLRRRPDYED